MKAYARKLGRLDPHSRYAYAAWGVWVRDGDCSYAVGTITLEREGSDWMWVWWPSNKPMMSLRAPNGWTDHRAWEYSRELSPGDAKYCELREKVLSCVQEWCKNERDNDDILHGLLYNDIVAYEEVV